MNKYVIVVAKITAEEILLLRYHRIPCVWINDRNILSSSSIKYVFRWLESDLAKQLAITDSRETIKFRKKDLTMVKMIINDIKEWRNI